MRSRSIESSGAVAMVLVLAACGGGSGNPPQVDSAVLADGGTVDARPLIDAGVTPDAALVLADAFVAADTAVDAIALPDATTFLDVAMADALVGPALDDLVPSLGMLAPAFSPGRLTYQLDLGLAPQLLSLTPSTSFPGATITVNGVAVASGSGSPPVSLDFGDTTFTIVVTDPATAASLTYAVVARRGRGLFVETDLVLTAAVDGDYLGQSVSIDGSTMAVAARGERGGAGAVYILTRSGSSWLSQATLRASNAEAGDSFGWAVSLSGDTIAIGAMGESGNRVNGETDNSAARSGAVYVFVRSGSAWSQQAYIKASNVDAGDGFGQAVSLSGDTLVASATREASSAVGINQDDSNNSAAGSGAAYVFVRSGTVWTQQAYLKASNSEAGDLFGIDVSLAGDTLAVGSYESSAAKVINGDQTDNSAGSAGAVYVFTRSGITWTQQAYLKASNAGAQDHFGRSVSLSGNSLAVGAIFEDSNARGVNLNQADDSAADSGAVYLFTRSGGAWSQQAYLKASNTEATDRFGFVSLSGDVLAVGATGEDSGSPGVNGDQNNNAKPVSGAAYVFARNGATWSQQSYLKASPPGVSDFFGWSVAVSGDTVVVGAPEADVGASNSGIVYVFRGDVPADCGVATGSATIRAAPGTLVVFHCPDGRPTSVVVAGPNGARAPIVAGGMATILYGGGGYRTLTTTMALQPGDIVKTQRARTGGTLGTTAAVTVPTQAGATSYFVQANCNRAERFLGAPGTLMQNVGGDGCVDASAPVVHALAFAGLEDEPPTAFTFMKSVPFAGATTPITLPAWRTDFTPHALELRNAPADIYYGVFTQSGVTIGDVWFPFPTRDARNSFEAAIAPGGSVTYRPSLATGFGDAVYHKVNVVAGVTTPSDVSSQVLYRKTMGQPASLSVDLVADFLPRIRNVQIGGVDFQRPEMSFTADGSHAGADVMTLLFSWRTSGYRWGLDTDPATSSPVRIPELPTSLAAWRPPYAQADPPGIYVMDIDIVNGWSQVKTSGLPEWNVDGNQPPAGVGQARFTGGGPGIDL